MLTGPSLRDSSQPWLKQTSRYMLGRVELNRAQANAFGDYGELNMDKVAAKAVTAAETEFLAYLRDYPAGAYAASAGPSSQSLLGGRSAAKAGS
ncbi:MAG: hypothetical protein ACREDV_11080 [Methylocella sp.]